ncbi:hypothetical protein [Deinococcus hopiensis]|uniref:EamA-like transporter family protein n=1 Tax=Deinococcus hopiensis KR-140 TaxID=695939 RepID=A0A1W1VQD4_9DEIO|nr:hypothetical protein [Deinococcus hopiensis]SMB95592.1 hypothetical protein SAMN00790413_02906 [Deinococcus hopiensis KR-140]
MTAPPTSATPPGGTGHCSPPGASVPRASWAGWRVRWGWIPPRSSRGAPGWWWGRATLLGAGPIYTLVTFCYFGALTRVTAGLLLYLVPAFVVLSVWLTGHRPDAARLGALALATLGLGLVIGIPGAGDRGPGGVVRGPLRRAEHAAPTQHRDAMERDARHGRHRHRARRALPVPRGPPGGRALACACAAAGEGVHGGGSSAGGWGAPGQPLSSGCSCHSPLPGALSAAPAPRVSPGEEVNNRRHRP